MEIKSSQLVYLDDDQQILDGFAANFADEFKVHKTTKYSEALQILQENEIKVVLTNQRIPEKTGLEFIQRINKDYPEIICILISAYAEKTVLFKSINEIAIFRVLEKPVEPEEIRHTIYQAIEKYDAQKEKKRLETELKIALERAHKCERLKAEFLASISHEIRTPVNGIVGFASLLKENRQESKPLEYIDIIMDSALKLVGIVDDMVMASKIKAGELNIENHEIFLNDLLDDIYHTFAPEVENKGGIAFTVKYRTGNVKIPITTDREKLYNIFVHLLRNALKFTREGHIEFGIYNAQKMILYVKDSGTGISETDKPDIFNFFTQGKQKHFSAEIEGIGLGLSIVKGLVDLLQGKLWFESEKDKGSTFYFTF